MSKMEKLVARFLKEPRDFKWEELVRLLRSLGFEEFGTGKTSGSRKRFKNADNLIIRLHKPHPGKIVRVYVLKEVKEFLIREGFINGRD